MKILAVDQIRKLDNFTIENEPIASIDLMERAAVAFVEWFTDFYTTQETIATFCGIGNNGGDGLAISRLLQEKGYNVSAYTVGNTEKASEDFNTNMGRLKERPRDVSTSPPELAQYSVIIDAIFGSGLSRSVEGVYAEVIVAINQSEAEVVSVDIPSGLLADEYTASDIIVRADYTLAFQLPKLAFMFPESFDFVGQWQELDIGLSQQYIKEADCSNHYITLDVAQGLVKSTSKFDHKGSNGHALIIAGAYGTIGAAVLATRAAIKTGLGLLTVNVPKCGYDILQSTVPEAMTVTDEHERHISVAQKIGKYEALGIGPGIGKHADTVKALIDILKFSFKPIVLDADALNIISKRQELLDIIPKKSILTPHVKEFERLFGSWENDFERLNKQKEAAVKYDLIIVLKGAHTAIALPTGEVYFNSTGNPGMAKGGSGDVLCGVITSLLAQHYSSSHAAILGVYLHGLAGDMAREWTHEKSMSASDIIDAIPEAYHFIDAEIN